jgi:hypothetical protein
MGSATASARIEFPAHLIDDEIKEELGSEYDITFNEGQPQCEYADVEVEIVDGIFGLHDSDRNYGEFEHLEMLLVEKGVPFDRRTGMDWSIEPRLRVFRPGGVDDSFLLDPESYEPVVPVAQIRALLTIDDAGEAAASAIRRWLDKHFPAYPPLSDWVKEALNG